MLSLLLPQPPNAHRALELAVSVTAVLVGLVTWYLPWRRWPTSRTLWLVPIALLLIAARNSLAGSVDPTYGIFFVVVFLWVGIAHPQWTSLYFAPAAAASYVIPLTFLPGPSSANAATAVITIPVCVLVGESLARLRERLRDTKSALLAEQSAAERLRALEEMKNLFLQGVSHELRTPLTAVLGFALTLENDSAGLTSAQREMVRRIAKNARKLHTLLSELLDLDRLSRGMWEPHPHVVDVTKLVRDLLADLERADHHFVVEGSSVTANLDVPAVERIVENLVVNASRYTPPGSTVWVKVEEKAEAVLISVEDDGPGVPEEAREAIFEPFQQGPGMHGHAPGTGIGLTLVSKLAEAHGGRAWVEERPGGGAAFRVVLSAGLQPSRL